MVRGACREQVTHPAEQSAGPQPNAWGNHQPKQSAQDFSVEDLSGPGWTTHGQFLLAVTTRQGQGDCDASSAASDPQPASGFGPDECHRAAHREEANGS